MAKDSPKVSLDALIPREAFEIQQQQGQNIGRNVPMISVRDLEKASFFYPFLRKPDFQRETNEWEAEKICEFIESFLDGDLIPSVILWRSSSSYYFVIDGSHRLSSLIAWINDDYGDGKISKEFYDGDITEEQKHAAQEVRKLIKTKIGTYKDYQSLTQQREQLDPKTLERARNLGALGIQTKSAAFIRDALPGSPRCKICGGYLPGHVSSIDHIKRKADGGLGTLDNAQLTHPYCNTTFKN
jgi:Protein of unknown function DUF262/HNH endonuclease